MHVTGVNYVPLLVDRLTTRFTRCENQEQRKRSILCRVFISKYAKTALDLPEFH